MDTRYYNEDIDFEYSHTLPPGVYLIGDVIAFDNRQLSINNIGNRLNVDTTNSDELSDFQEELYNLKYFNDEHDDIKHVSKINKFGDFYYAVGAIKPHSDIINGVLFKKSNGYDYNIDTGFIFGIANCSLLFKQLDITVFPYQLYDGGTLHKFDTNVTFTWNRGVFTFESLNFNLVIDTQINIDDEEASGVDTDDEIEE